MPKMFHPDPQGERISSPHPTILRLTIDFGFG